MPRCSSCVTESPNSIESLFVWPCPIGVFQLESCAAIPLRKYLVATGNTLERLLQEDKDRDDEVFTRCVLSFLGARFVAMLTGIHLDKPPLMTSRRVSFTNERLPRLDFPFDRAPRPAPDLLFHVMNNEIGVSLGYSPVLGLSLW